MAYVDTIDCEWLHSLEQRTFDDTDTADGITTVGPNVTEEPDTYYTISFDQYWYCSKQYHLHDVIKTWAPPVMIVSGSVGNALAFVVLSRSNIRQWSICVYLAIFALCNTLVLYVGCGLDWVAHITETPYVANRADWICRLWQFIFNVIIYTSGWLVVAMMIDRFVTVCVPAKARVVCTVFIAKVVCILIVVFLVVISIHAMWTYELTENGCYIDPEQRDFQYITWPYISAILYSYMPLASTAIMATIVFVYSLTCHRAESELTTQDAHQVVFTRVALIVAFCYIVMSLPTVIINFIDYHQPRYPDYQKLAKLYLAKTMGQTVACFSHSISYIIYFTTVPLFRSEFVSIINRLFSRRQAVRDRQVVTHAEVRSICANGETKHEDVITTLL